MPDFDAQLAALETSKGALVPEPGDADFINNPLPDDDEDVTVGGEEGDAVYSSEDEEAIAAAAAGEGKPPAAPAKKPADGAKPAPADQEALKAALPDTLRALYEKAQQEKEDQKGLARKEREQRRAIEARDQQREAAFRQQAAELQRMQGLLHQLTNPAPDPEVNVVEALKYTQQQLAQRQQADMQRLQRQQQESQQTAFVTQLKSTVEDFEAEFSLENPDYEEASNWLIDQKQKELEMLGAPPHVAAEGALNTAIQMARVIVSNGKNPAEVAYAMAKAQGWKPAGAVDPAVVAAAAAAAGKTPQQIAADKLAQLRAGQDAGKTLSGGGNGGNAGPPTLKRVLDLDGAAGQSAREKWLDDMIKGRSRA